jgi:ligand-binding sensor domain-containing protein
MRVLPLYFFVFFPALLIAGNSPFFRHLRISDGLPQQSVTVALRDRHGVMWLGTRDGLCRWDGHRIKVFTPGPEAGSLKSGLIVSMCTDSAGRLLVLTSTQGLSVYDEHTRAFMPFPLQKPDASLRYFRVHKSAAGAVYVTTSRGLYKLIFPGVLAAEFDAAMLAKLADHTLTQLAEDRQGCLWLASAKGVSRYNPATRELVNARNNVRRWNCFDTLSCSALAVSGNSVWWANYSGHIRAYDLVSGSLQVYDSWLSKKRAFNVVTGFAFGDGEMWMSMSLGGLIHHKGDREQPYIYTHIKEEEWTLAADECESLMLDAYGFLWVYTAAGLSYSQTRAQLFHIFRLDADADAGQITSVVMRDDSTLLLALGNGEFRLWYIYENRFAPMPVPEVLRRQRGYVWRMHRDRRNFIWISAGDYLCCHNPRTASWQLWPMRDTREGGFGGNPATAFLDYRNELLIATYSRKIWHYDYTRNTFSPYTYTQQAPLDHMIMDLAEDRQGNLWISTNGEGLQHYTAGGMQRFTSDPADTSTLPFQVANAVLPHMGTQVWVGCYSGGAAVYDVKEKKWTRIHTLNSPLPNNQVNSLLADKENNVWLFTSNGMARWDVSKKKLRSFTSENGLPFSFFDNYTQQLLPDGRIVACSGIHLLVFNPAETNREQQLPPPVLTDIDFRRMEKMHIVFAGKELISLKPPHHSFTAFFSARTYGNMKDIAYRCKLIGFDQQWQETESYVSYKNLPAGTYSLHVMYRNANGQWSADAELFSFRILPPFYETWWFRAGVLVLLAALIWLVAALRIRQIKRREEEKTTLEKQWAELEMKALRAQMNPHFIFNSMNSVNSYILNNDPQAASEYIARFAKLIRLILDNSNSALVTLNQEKELLENYLLAESMRFDQPFQWRIYIAPEIDPFTVKLPSMLLQPYVENAIWHGLQHRANGGGKLNISFFMQGQSMVCCIEDNGIGRAAAAAIQQKRPQAHRSHGLHINSARLEMISRRMGKPAGAVITDLTDDNGIASGTRVEITLPVETDE